MFKKLWKKFDGKKLWTAVSIAIGYGVGVARAKYPLLPWDELIIPTLLSLGVIGAGHKMIKAQSKKTRKVHP